MQVGLTKFFCNWK